MWWFVEPFADEDKPATIVLRKGDPSNLMDVSTLTSKLQEHLYTTVSTY